MDKQIKILKRIWKTGLISLVVAVMVFGGLILNLKAALATGTPTPNMTVRQEGLIGSGGNWSHNVTLNPGDEVQFYAEIHNTVVGSTADNVTFKANVTGGNFTNGTSVATVTAANANTASDTVNIHINGGGSLEFIDHSARVTWDVDGDGNKEFNMTRVAGNPMSGNGLLIGDQKGCNEFIIQVYWAARVKGAPQASPSPSPTPSPTPTPTPSPTPTPTPTPVPPTGGQNQEQNQSQTQNNNQNQTVNVTNTNTNTVNVPEVKGVSVPLKQPETGVSVLGLASMFGAAPVGIALSRFGRGRTLVKKDDEELGQTAFRLLNTRSSGKSA